MSIVIGGHGFLLMTDNANLQTQYANFAGGHGRQGGSLRLSGSGSQTGGGQIGGSGVGNGGGIGKELDEELDEELERDGGPTDELDEELDEELEGGGGSNPPRWFLAAAWGPPWPTLALTLLPVTVAALGNGGPVG